MATTTETAEQGSGFTGNRQKVAAHLTQNEPLLFEKSSPGKRGYRLPPLDVPEADATKLLGDAARTEAAALPELSEIEIIRHFTRLSTWNYAIDLGMYPLGSCTMKYNPRVNEYRLASGRHRRSASLSTGVAFAGCARCTAHARKSAHRNHRHGDHHLAARRRRAR